MKRRGFLSALLTLVTLPLAGLVRREHFTYSEDLVNVRTRVWVDVGDRLIAADGLEPRVSSLYAIEVFPNDSSQRGA